LRQGQGRCAMQPRAALLGTAAARQNTTARGCTAGHLRGCLARSARVWRFDRPKARHRDDGRPARENVGF
jgi:hypothetical protein